jgi:hypothetical protein
LKGIMTREDAKEALRRGDGVIVSNHGGRAEESGQATVGVLVDVVDVVGGKIPVLVDGGVRRGTDVLKALALGAMAVGIGRPYVWGLASFGEAGVDRVLEIMDNEFTTIMRQVGALNINQITRDNVIRSLPLPAVTWQDLRASAAASDAPPPMSAPTSRVALAPIVIAADFHSGYVWRLVMRCSARARTRHWSDARSTAELATALPELKTASADGAAPVGHRASCRG